MDQNEKLAQKPPLPVKPLSSPTSFHENDQCREDLNVDKFGFFGGEQYCLASPSSDKEDNTDKKVDKWNQMFSNWNDWMLKDYYHLRARCRKGIPMSQRPLAWQYLCGSYFYIKKYRGEYSTMSLCKCPLEVIDEIQKDTYRQFPNHTYFAGKGGQGQQALARLLRLYAVVRPDVGYSQAQAPIAASLLIHMKEEEAFWTYLCINEFYLAHYYEHDMEYYGIELLPVCVDWFMCLFTRNLPWDTVLRVLDQFFCEGIKVIFRVALAIFELLFEDFRRCSKQDLDAGTIMMAIRKLPPHIVTESVLIPTSLKYVDKITKDELSSMHIRKREELYKIREVGPTDNEYYLKTDKTIVRNSSSKL
ncbi:hypothetical protein Ciccas_003470 [Cichlidogyrus casuarinus]|uniref:Rab-GAP TBC domain-containing protein n=1 Tax=Cichlidogyrus casuarinus TaxID=1844966 RepID=A0ABD2QE92_9PLAT